MLEYIKQNSSKNNEFSNCLAKGKLSPMGKDGHSLQMKNSSTTSARLALMGSMIVFGSIGLFRRWIPLPSGMLSMLRGLIGAGFLLLIMLIFKKPIDRSAIRKNLITLLLSGAMIGFNWILLFEAYRFTTVATATLCYYMQPVFVLLAAPIFLKEKLTAKSVVCAVLALVGMVLVTGVATGTVPSKNDTVGILLGLAAAALYAGVILVCKKLTEIDAYNKTFIQLGTAGIVLIPYTLLAETCSVNQFSTTVVLLVLVVGLVHTGIAYTLYFGSMRPLPARTIAIFSYIDPIVALLLSALFLKEPMGIFEICGAALILGSTLFSELSFEKKSFS